MICAILFIPSEKWESRAVDSNTINIHVSDTYIGLDLSQVGGIIALNFMIFLSDDQFYTFSIRLYLMLFRLSKRLSSPQFLIVKSYQERLQGK